MPQGQSPTGRMSAREVVRDPGPIYTETRGGRFPVEPWNTASNLTFLALIIYCAWRTRLRIRRHPLIVGALPVLLVGFVGGTVYHATRSHRIWLMLDYMPITLLTLAAAWYLWRRIFANGALAAACLLSFPLLFLAVHPLMMLALPTEQGHNLGISMGYGILALTIVVPAVVHCRLHARGQWPWLVGAFVAFLVAITCRSIDLGLGARLLPMGTHFLWHVFGAVSTFCLFVYLLRDDEARLNAEEAAREAA